MISVFKSQDYQLTVYGTYDRPLFKAQEVGQLIDYKCIRSVLRTIPTDFMDVRPTHTLGGMQETTFLTESGLYYLVLRSNKPRAVQFQKWVVESVLPSIRKTGEYSLGKNVHQKLCYKMENEYDLHTKTVDFIRHRYPNALLQASLGENQDTSNKRIKSFCQGYEAGSPDLILMNLHKKYSGMVIEFKSPNGQGILSEKQNRVLKNLELNNYRVVVSNNYDDIVFEIISYMNEVRVLCNHCRRRFRSVQSLGQHTRGFHKVSV